MAITIVSADFAWYGTGPYWIYNDIWNNENLVNGVGYTETIGVNSDLSSIEMDWSWPSVVASDGVYSYPNVTYGWFFGDGPAAGPMPVASQAANFLSLSATYNLELSGATNGYDVIFDMYF